MGLIAGSLLQLQGKAGLAGWQWLFLIEGLPAIVLSLVFLFYLPTGPAEAEWLTEDERRWILHHVSQAGPNDAHGVNIFRALSDRRVLQVGLIFLSMLTCGYAYTLSAPAILEALTALSNRNVGFLVAAMSLLGAPCMLLNAMHSDRTRERYFHVAIPFLIMAVCYAVGGLTTMSFLAVPALALAALSYYSLQGPLLAVATSFLHGKSAAAGIAAMNTIGMLGGFIGPWWMGLARDRTGTYQPGLLALIVPSLLAATTIFLMRSNSDRREAN
jgi:ACS family tartrate transporter-like MFS transporter